LLPCAFLFTSEFAEFEEFYSHRLVDGGTVLMPPAIDALPGLVTSLRADDARARAVAARGAAWARAELTRGAAWCYWACLIASLAELQTKGGALQPRPGLWRSQGVGGRNARLEGFVYDDQPAGLSQKEKAPERTGTCVAWDPLPL